MAENYWIGYAKEPFWTGSTSVPKSKRKSRQYFYPQKNFEEAIAKADLFCEKYGISRKDIKMSYSNWYADIPETDEEFNKRVETWKSEREKYKALREKWLEKKRQEKKVAEAKRAAAETNDEFVVVRLTPAQYKKLVAST